MLRSYPFSFCCTRQSNRRSGSSSGTIEKAVSHWRTILLHRHGGVDLMRGLESMFWEESCASLRIFQGLKVGEDQKRPWLICCGPGKCLPKIRMVQAWSPWCCCWEVKVWSLERRGVGQIMWPLRCAFNIFYYKEVLSKCIMYFEHIPQDIPTALSL